MMITESDTQDAQGIQSTQSIKTRITFIMLGCMGLAFTVILRAAYIQLPQNSRLETVARRQFQSRALITPRRGAILDRHGDPLAVNVEANSLAANPTKILNKRVAARHLSKALDIPYSKLFRKLSEKREFTWIKRHLSESELRRFKKFRLLRTETDIADGLWLVRESERVYPQGKLASHILGAVNIDSEGLEGIELWKNESLRGKVVSITAIKDALGRPTFIDAAAAKSVQDGEPVKLTIDASLQFEVEQHLESAVKRTGSRSGTAIVMNATNGEILAMANEPSFNLNDKFVSLDKRRNRAMTDGYEPGSTLKALLLTGVLSNGGRLTDQVWGERGSFTVQGHKISEAEAREKFEWVSLKKMIQVSSNVAAAKFALKLGADRYLQTLRGFGLGVKTGSGFPGEISGRLLPRKEWGPLALSNIGFGQGILVTPIQMTRAYAALLNGGWLVRPSVIKSTDPQTTVAPVRIFSERVAAEGLEALASVTEEGGTGVKAALPGYRVAGKTGTAQMVDPGRGGYARNKYVSSFIGFPLGVDPKIVIFVSLTEPKGVYYASLTAAPLFREVLSSVANHLSLPVLYPVSSPPILAEGTTTTDKIKTTKAAPTTASPTSEAPSGRLELSSNSNSHWVIPSWKGLSPREVLGLLKGHNIHLEITGAGVVSSQVPEPGKVVAEGGKVRLILSDP